MHLKINNNRETDRRFSRKFRPLTRVQNVPLTTGDSYILMSVQKALVAHTRSNDETWNKAWAKNLPLTTSRQAQ